MTASDFAASTAGAPRTIEVPARKMAPAARTVLMAHFSPGSATLASPPSGWRARIGKAAAVAMMLLLTARSGHGAELPHDAEIKLFATSMAIVRTVNETCPDILVDTRIPEVIRHELHVVEADYPAFAGEAHAFAGELKDAIAAAPSRQAWCDAVFRLYGPTAR